MSKFKALFLGPHGENVDTFLSFIKEVVYDHAFWRKNFHPEDIFVISEEDKTSDTVKQTISRMRQELALMLQKLKKEVPCYSPRYIGHMLSETLLPAIIGYIATMLYNPNNVTSEVSSVTTQFEIEVGKDFARMVGFSPDNAWGHITSGGTVANIEALWVARNLKYYPLAIKKAAEELNLSIEISDDLSPDEILELRERLAELLFKKEKSNSYEFSEMPSNIKKEFFKKVDDIISKYTISALGWKKFSEENNIASGIVLVPKTKHYSWVKAVDLLGIGKNNLIGVDIDVNWRIDVNDLEKKLKKYKDRIIMVVAVPGSTEEGSIDDIARIVELKNKYKFYLHLDAAYGGYLASMLWKNSGQKSSMEDFTAFLNLSIKKERIKYLYHSLDAFKGADSITIDPHKLGYIPYQAGGIVFKNAKIRELISVSAPYVFHEDSGLNFIGQFILEGSKAGATAAAVYISHKVVGLDENGYGNILKNTIVAANKLHDELNKKRKIRQIKLIPIGAPDSNIVCFTLNYTGNHSLRRANRLVEAVFKEFTPIYEKPINQIEFVISKTDFTYEEYFSKATQNLLKNMEIPEDKFVLIPQSQDEDNKIAILRMTVMNPWHVEKVIQGEDGLKTPIEGFVEALEKVLKKYSPKIWIIEDNDNDYLGIEQILNSTSDLQQVDLYRTIYRDEALKLIAEDKIWDFDLIIIDLQLPISEDMQALKPLAGIDILRKIRKKSFKNKSKLIPVVVYTFIEPSIELMEELRLAGYNDKTDTVIYKGKDPTSMRKQELRFYREVFQKILGG